MLLVVVVVVVAIVVVVTTLTLTFTLLHPSSLGSESFIPKFSFAYTKLVKDMTKMREK